MHTPSWLLKIIASYLSGRTMMLSFHGAQSSIKELAAGTPQGALLGGLIFMIKFNAVFLRPTIPRPSELSDVKTTHVKYVDDGAVAVSVDLKSHLIPDPETRPLPLAFRERTRHILPPGKNLLQHFISDVQEFANVNNMAINKSKTNLMLFSKSRKYDFPPEVQFSDGSKVETVGEQTLLGVVISDDLKWKRNTDFICSKARRKLWVLRRMMNLDLDEFQLFDVYKKEVRTILEYAAPVWHSSITKKQSSQIESVQKLAFRIILKQSYSSYKNACSFFETVTLKQRRLEICSRFALKNVESSNSLFKLAENDPRLRTRRTRVLEYKCRTKRYQRSSLPFLASLLNSSGLAT